VKKKVLSVFLSLLLVLGVTFTNAGCSTVEFTTVLNEVGPAVGVILQIVALSSGKTVGAGLQAKVTADSAALNTLITTFDAAAAADKGSIQAEVNGAFATLQQDLSQVFTLAQVSNPATQAKIASLITLVQGLVQIAEAAIPAPAATATASATVKRTPVSASEFVSTWNKTLTAKTGDAKVDAYTAKHQYHRHGWAVRQLTFHVAQ
jgi:hypothetical protein